MSTLYELFKVNEDATQDEITKAYNEILKKADSLPQTEKIVEQVRRMKIAYGILSDPEKRKKYDSDLATQKANELLENVQVKKQEMQMDDGQAQLDEERIKQIISKQIDNIVEKDIVNTITDNQKQKLAEKEQRKQLKKEKRDARKQQQLKREMEIQAYGKYLENQGYKVKYPWTWLRIKRLILTILAIIISLFILWHIPFVKKTLKDLYDENFVIRFLVDSIKSIIDSIKSIFY